MSTKRFVDASEKQDAERELKKRPVLVLFFMQGCPHCEANEKAWNEVKESAPKETKILEIESAATPESAGVKGFPTMKKVDADGEEKTIEGKRESGKEIEEELELKSSKKGSGRRRNRSLRRTNRRRNRKLRYRTLRNYVAL
jgi:hypothetical protein